MNEIVNTFSLAGDKFLPEIHLRQPEFVYSACGPFTKNKERKQKFNLICLMEILKILLWSEEDFVMKKVKISVPGIYVLSDLNGEKNVGTFY